MYTLDKMDVGSMTDDELAWWMNGTTYGSERWEGVRQTRNFVRVARDWYLSYNRDGGYDISRYVLVVVAFPRVRSMDFKVSYSGASAFVKRAYAAEYIEEEVAHMFERAMLLRAANPSLIYDR